MGGAWGLGIFQSDYDYDIIQELSFQAGLGRLEHGDALKTGEKPLNIIHMFQAGMFKLETGFGGSERIRNLEHGLVGKPPKQGAIYYSIYDKLCSNPDRVRDHMDDGALDDMIKKFRKKARNNDRVNPSWRPHYVLVLLDACAMTLGCIIPEAFMKYLRKTYEDPKAVGLMRDALVQVRKALFGPGGYVDGEPYDFGTKGMRATALAGGAAKEDLLVPWQINVAAPDGDQPELLTAKPKEGVPPYSLHVRSFDDDKTFDVVMTMQIDGKVEQRVLAKGYEDRTMADLSKMLLGTMLSEKMVGVKGKPKLKGPNQKQLKKKSTPEPEPEPTQEPKPTQDPDDEPDTYSSLDSEPGPEIKVDCCGECKAEKPAEEAALLVCGKCKTIRYCSRECQKKDWAAHKTLCKWVVEWKAVNKKQNVPPGPLTADFCEELAMVQIKTTSPPLPGSDAEIP